MQVNLFFFVSFFSSLDDRQLSGSSLCCVFAFYLPFFLPSSCPFFIQPLLPFPTYHLGIILHKNFVGYFSHNTSFLQLGACAALPDIYSILVVHFVWLHAARPMTHAHTDYHHSSFPCQSFSCLAPSRGGGLYVIDLLQ